MTHLKRLSAELGDSLDANSKAQDRIRDVENQLHDHTVKIRELRRQRGSIADITDDESGDTGRRAA
jgi:predicted  nucleic acid-binding Zn-ribbon protein